MVSYLDILDGGDIRRI